MIQSIKDWSLLLSIRLNYIYNWCAGNPWLLTYLNKEGLRLVKGSLKFSTQFELFKTAEHCPKHEPMFTHYDALLGSVVVKFSSTFMSKTKLRCSDFDYCELYQKEFHKFGLDLLMSVIFIQDYKMIQPYHYACCLQWNLSTKHKGLVKLYKMVF